MCPTDLWCYIEGECDIFGVSISPNRTIHDMKKQIYDEERRPIDECAPTDLALAKVCYCVS